MKSWLPIAFCAALAPSVAVGTEPSTGDAPPPVGIPHACAEYYPVELQRIGIEGTTTLSFVIGRRGGVSGVTVEQSSGNKVLDTAAVFCAAHWRYKPATRDGQPVQVSWRASVVWQLPKPIPRAQSPWAKP